MSETPGSPEAMYSPDQLFERMHHRVVELAATWKLYRSLYSDKEQVKRMNRVSRVGFGIMQRSMIHDLIRGVYAITDQAGKGKRKNLSLERLVENLADRPPSSALDRARNLVAELGNVLDAIRIHRNRRLMHFDLETAMVSGKNLPKLLFDDLQRAIDLIWEAMSSLSEVHNGSGMIYEWTSLGNAEGELQWLLKDSVRYRHLRKLAKDPSVECEVLRTMVQDRGGRQDPQGLSPSDGE